MKIFKYFKRLYHKLFKNDVVHVKNIISHQPDSKIIKLSFIISSNYIVDPIHAVFLELERNPIIFKAINTFRVGLEPCTYDNLITLYNLFIRSKEFTKEEVIKLKQKGEKEDYIWLIEMDLLLFKIITI